VLPYGAEAIYPGWKISINVTVRNEGDFTETFNVTVYYDHHTIGTQNVTNLAPGANTTLTFPWNTTGVPPCPFVDGHYVPYIISANVTSPILGEISSYLPFYGGTLVIRLPADASCNGKVNVLDLGMLGYAWLAKYGEPKYGPRCDFNGDGAINVIDLGLLGVWWLYPD